MFQTRVGQLAAQAIVVTITAVGAEAAPRAAGQADGAMRAAALRITGDVSADVWQMAAVVDDFAQREPIEGGRPTERTEFRVAYDATTVIVKVRAWDSRPEAIAGYLTRRDGESPSDWIRVLIDSYHDRRTAYEFAVNPVGVKQDRYWFNDTQTDASWDAVWDVSVGRDAEGWTAEFRIPLSQLRFNPSASTTFGFAIARDIGRLNETATWPLLARSATGYVSSFGELTGLSITTAPKRLELLPYTVATLTTEPAGTNPLLKSTAPGGAFGLDLKYALTPSLTLTTTINPDFGQVEADPAEVNLSAFESFFSEQRPFFIEGSGTFRFDSDCPNGPCTMFYSRRIGRAPQGSLPSGDGVSTSVPVQTTILGAGKLTGRAGPFAIGIMQALTERESATVLDAGARSIRPVEPLTSYTVARIRREFKNQSSLGAIATATRRQDTENLAVLPGGAYVGGLDWDMRFAKWYAMTGYLAASAVHGTSEAITAVQQTSRHYFQRPDTESLVLDTTRTSLNGASGRIGVKKIGGQHIRFNANVGRTSPAFEINDAGFLRRADERWTSNWIQARSETPNRWFRSRYLNGNQWAAWNADGDRVIAGSNVNGNAQFLNNWAVGGGIGRDWRVFDDRLTRGGPGGLAGGYTIFWSSVDSDNRRPVSFNLFNGAGHDPHGSSHRDHEINVTYRPTSALSLSPGLRINKSVRDYQWVADDDAAGHHYVFAHLDQTTVAVTGRLNYTMTPTLSLQLYAQPFVSGGDYTGFKELTDGRNPTYDNRYAPYAYSYDADANPDFNVKSFRTTNVLRWEFKPGSTLFVVWQQGREDSAAIADFRFRRDFGNVFRVPARNVFLVKLAYWLNY